MASKFNVQIENTVLGIIQIINKTSITGNCYLLTIDYFLKYLHQQIQAVHYFQTDTTLIHAIAAPQ